MTDTTIEIPGAAPMGQLERIMCIFTAPSKTFSDIQRSAAWWAPWLLMAVFSLGFAFTVGAKIGWEQVQENNLKMGPANQREALEKAPAEQREQQLRIGLAITKAIGYGWPVMSLIGLVIVALVLWGTFKFGVGAEVGFGQSLAILIYASLPGILHAVLAVVVLFAGMDPSNFIIQNSVGTNIGWYMNIEETPRFLYGLLSALDAFMLWTLFLTGLGFSIVGKVKKNTAMAIVFGWWIVVSIVSAGFGAAFS